MSSVEDKVSSFIKTREGKVFGIKLGSDEYLYSLESKRGEPWEPPDTEGSSVKVEWAPYEKDGKTKRYITTIETLAASAPEAPESAPASPDGQFRSPQDFRRTSALAQSVLRHNGPGSMTAEPATDEDIILTALRFEKYLGSGE